MGKDILLLAGQIVVVIVLGICVALGHNSAITDALIAVSGSVAGIGVYEKLKSK